MSKHTSPADELPSLDVATLDRVTGGAGMDPMAMMMFAMGRKRNAAAAAPAPAPAPQPWKPKILLNGVEQPVTTGADGAMTVKSSTDDSDPSSSTTSI